MSMSFVIITTVD